MWIALYIACTIFALGCLSQIFGWVFIIKNELFETEVWVPFLLGGLSAMGIGLLVIFSLVVISLLL